MICQALTIIGLCLLVASALRDIAVRAVPNRFALAILLCGLGVHVADRDVAASLLVFLIVFFGAAVFWYCHWMGGADVKLLAAVTLLVQPALVPSLLAAIALSGGVLALVYLVARHRVPAPPSPRPAHVLRRILRTERWRLRRGGPLPYAVAIASGAAITVVHGGLL